jgi:hypothetical protein
MNCIRNDAKRRRKRRWNGRESSMQRSIVERIEMLRAAVAIREPQGDVERHRRDTTFTKETRHEQ